MHKSDYNNLLIKVYKHLELNMEDIKHLVFNPIEVVTKVEIYSDGNRLKYRVYFENDASVNIGNVF